MDPATPRPLYNRAKERLLRDKQITSYTIASFEPELYCEVGKHFDYIWFEMQHGTMSYDDIRRMLLACPRVGAAPMLRLPDALESSIQKATDLGALGIIVPTVDDAVEARDAARFSRYPPFGRRSAGGGAYWELWNAPGLNYRATINDNMLVTVMIETLEGVAWPTRSPPRTASTSSCWASTISQVFPACDGWRPAGRETAAAEEPVVGLPAGQKPAAQASTGAVGDRPSCWP